MRARARRLTVLDLMFGAGLRTSQGQDGKDQRETGCDPYRTFHVRVAIKQQMARGRDFSSIPWGEDQFGRSMPRMLRIAERYLELSSWSFQLEEYVDSLREARTILDLNYFELRFSIAAVQQAVLVKLYESLSSLPDGSSLHGTSWFNSLCDVAKNVTRVDLAPLLEGLNSFEDILKKDPSGCYERLQNETKDRYRCAVGSMAARSRVEERRVAQFALLLCLEERNQGPEQSKLRLHIGYYLIDIGAAELVIRLTSKSNAKDDSIQKLPLVGWRYYLYLQLTLTVLSATIAMSVCYPQVDSIISMAFFSIGLVVACWTMANETLDSLLVLFSKPRILPEMNFDSGVPVEFKTCVSVPVVLRDYSQIVELVTSLEKQFSRINDANILFGLLTDFPDSSAGPATDCEERLLDELKAMIGDLNRKHGDVAGGTFFLLHRKRIFSPMQRKWIGWERKRGKLMLLNSLILGGGNPFDQHEGDLAAIVGARFVIVLDEDSDLSWDGARRLIGSLAHPLNRLQRNSGQTERGYGILQPASCISSRSAGQWRLASVIMGPSCDPLTPRVSFRNVDFDVFGSCSYLGKGIYDVRQFHESISGAFPEERILSHDTIEAGLLRTGFAGSVAVIEPRPRNYRSYCARQHRWVRGDWQNFWAVFTGLGGTRAQRLRQVSPVIRYSILSFLRRSLLPIARLSMYVSIVFAMPALIPKRILTILILFLLPEITQILGEVAKLVYEGRLIYSGREILLRVRTAFLRELFFTTACLQQSILMADAISRTFYRVLLRQNLLSWTPAGFMQDRHLGVDVVDISSLLAIVIGLVGMTLLFTYEHTSFSGWLIVLLVVCVNPWIYWNRGRRGH
jgi:hypothetical protein